MPNPSASPPVMRSMRALIWSACALVLTSCSSGTPRTRVEVPPRLIQLQIPLPPVAPLIPAPCERLPLAPSDLIPALIDNHQRVAALYHRCAAKLEAAREAVRTRELSEQDRLRSIREGSG